MADSPFPAIWSMILLQQLTGQLCDVPPCMLNVPRVGAACADGEAQDKEVGQLARHQVDLSAIGDPL